jgi:hypothetical protein
MNTGRLGLLAACAVFLAGCHGSDPSEPTDSGVGGRWTLELGLHDNSGFSCTYHLSAMLTQTGDSVKGTLKDLGSSCQDQNVIYQADPTDGMGVLAILQDSTLYGFLGGFSSGKSFQARISGNTMTGGAAWTHTAPDTIALSLTGSLTGTHD